jgi:hypothetical protein
MSGGISIGFVDFPAVRLRLIVLVALRFGCFWRETGAAQTAE